MDLRIGHFLVAGRQSESYIYKLTLYNPKKPSSLMTLKALTLAVPTISPATCSRIFTISKGLVNITCEAPACN